MLKARKKRKKWRRDRGWREGKERHEEWGRKEENQNRIKMRSSD